MVWDWLGWLLAVGLVLVGLAGTVLPVLPGPVLVWLGLVAAAWLEGFEHVGAIALGFMGLFAGLAHLLDFVAGAAGTRWARAGPRAFWGAALGTLVGLFFGLPGIILGPFLGAVIGELTVVDDLPGATRAGVGAWLGVLAGTAVKIGLTFLMVALYLLNRVL